MKQLGQGKVVAEVRERLSAVSPGDTARWGTMSVEEMLCHLREAFAGALAPRWKKPMPTPLPPPVMKFFALRVPLRWPKDVETVPELKRGAVVPPVDFFSDRAGLETALGRFLAAGDLRFPHPMFGAMEPWDWMRWGYLHTDHHLRQFGR